MVEGQRRRSREAFRGAGCRKLHSTAVYVCQCRSKVRGAFKDQFCASQALVTTTEGLRLYRAAVSLHFGSQLKALEADLEFQ